MNFRFSFFVLVVLVVFCLSAPLVSVDAIPEEQKTWPQDNCNDCGQRLGCKCGEYQRRTFSKWGVPDISCEDARGGRSAGSIDEHWCHHGQASIKPGSSEQGTCYIKNGGPCPKCPPGSWSGARAEFCTKCEPTFYSPVPGRGNPCTEQCPPGTKPNLGPGYGSTGCIPCPINGTWSEGNLADCVAAPCGTWVLNKAKPPLKCSKGTFNKLTQQHTPEACVDVPAGTYANETGQCAPTPCPVGTQLKFGGQWSIDLCEQCPLPFIARTTGTVACSEVCPAGSVPSRPVPSDCTLCESGFHAPKAGTGSCIPCPVGSTTNGAKGSDRCYRCSRSKWTAGPGSTKCVLRSELENVREWTYSVELTLSDTPVTMSQTATLPETVSASLEPTTTKTYLLTSSPTRSNTAVLSPSRTAVDSATITRTVSYTGGTADATATEIDTDTHTINKTVSRSRSVELVPPFMMSDVVSEASKVAVAAMTIAGGTVASVASSFSGSGAGSSAGTYGGLSRKIMAISGISDCGKVEPHEFKAPRLGMDSNPLGWEIGGGGDPRYSQYRGALVGNLVVILAWGVFIGIIALMRALIRGETLRHELRKCRMPGSLYVPASLLLPACAASFGSLIKVYSGEKGDVALISYGIFIAVLFPICFLSWLVYHVRTKEKLGEDAIPFNSQLFRERPFAALGNFLFQPKREFKHSKMIDRFGAIFDNVSLVYFVLYSNITLIVMSIAQGYSQMCTKGDQIGLCCNVPNLVILACAILDIIAIIAIRPFLIRVEGVLLPGLFLLNAISAVFASLIRFNESMRYLEGPLAIITQVSTYTLMGGIILVCLMELVPLVYVAFRDKCGGGSEEWRRVQEERAAKKNKNNKKNKDGSSSGSRSGSGSNNNSAGTNLKDMLLPPSNSSGEEAAGGGEELTLLSPKDVVSKAKPEKEKDKKQQQQRQREHAQTSASARRSSSGKQHRGSTAAAADGTNKKLDFSKPGAQWDWFAQVLKKKEELETADASSKNKTSSSAAAPAAAAAAVSGRSGSSSSKRKATTTASHAGHHGGPPSSARPSAAAAARGAASGGSISKTVPKNQSQRFSIGDL